MTLKDNISGVDLKLKLAGRIKNVEIVCAHLSSCSKILESLFTERSLERYNQQCNEIESTPNDETKRELQTTYGITTRSLLSTLPTFNITKQLFNMKFTTYCSTSLKMETLL